MHCTASYGSETTNPPPTTKRWRSDAATPFTGMILNSRSRRGEGHAQSDLPHPESPMFKELAPYLRQRSVLLTVTRLADDQISVNIIPKKLQDGENTALTTPFKLTGTAEELDRDLPSSIVDFVAAHLQLKSTLDSAEAEM